MADPVKAAGDVASKAADAGVSGFKKVAGFVCSWKGLALAGVIVAGTLLTGAGGAAAAAAEGGILSKAWAGVSAGIKPLGSEVAGTATSAFTKVKGFFGGKAAATTTVASAPADPVLNELVL